MIGTNIGEPIGGVVRRYDVLTTLSASDGIAPKIDEGASAVAVVIAGTDALTLAMSDAFDGLHVDLDRADILSLLLRDVSERYAIWPGDLPQEFVTARYQIIPDSGVVGTPMDSGRALQRKQFDQMLTTVSLRWQMTADQLERYRTWIEFDSAFGASWFLINMLLDDASRQVVARIVADKPPTINYVAPDMWNVDADVEIIDPPYPDTFAEFTWPVDLPQKPTNAYQIVSNRGAIRSDLPGLANQRKRFIQPLDKVSTSWQMTGAQLKRFKSFVALKTAMGAAWFDMTLTLDGGDRLIKARLVADTPPQFTYIAGIDAQSLWSVDFPIEIVNPPAVTPDVQEIIDNIGLDDLSQMADLVVTMTLQPFFENYAAMVN